MCGGRTISERAKPGAAADSGTGFVTGTSQLQRARPPRSWGVWRTVEKRHDQFDTYRERKITPDELTAAEFFNRLGIHFRSGLSRPGKKQSHQPIRKLRCQVLLGTRQS